MKSISDAVVKAVIRIIPFTAMRDLSYSKTFS